MNEVRSPEQIEREINDLRAQISDTLDAVQHKLSPGQMLDQALSYAKDGGAIAGQIGRGMKDNPVPAALFGLSLAWLWYSGSREEHDAEPHDDTQMHELRETIEHARLNIMEARDTGTNFVKKNPVTVAAAALAAGTLIGALLPRRRR